ncbi:MAG: GHMP kinase [Nitrospiraceae bacterium]|nr:GHMP kinase [Nitrospiraceae bacterium]
MSKRRVINAVAPIRVCDLGGWTDTWFAETGAVLNVAVYPYASVQIYVTEEQPAEKGRITIFAENFGDRYSIEHSPDNYIRHPLLEASVDIMELPDTLSFEINLYSSVPAGCSTGTSAAVTVALIGALDLLTPGQRTPHEIAALAHRVETEKLGLQCGIQDQICSAHGGICFVEMFDYPHASVSQLQIPNDVWWELERRLLLVYLGKTHSSSEVHGQVIAGLDQEGADKSALIPLRKAAREGKNALYAGDLKRFGRCMIDNTDGQAALHPALVSDAAHSVIALAKEHGAIGWKVNGAGGEGGSLSILCPPEGERRRAFTEALKSLDPMFEVIPTYFCPTGLRRWEVVE